MLKNKNDLKQYLKADYLANKMTKRKSLIGILMGGGVYAFLKKLRKLEFAINSNKKLIAAIRRYFYLKVSRKYGVQIPPNCFGPGLQIEHLVGIIVNPGARIGSNCTIHQFVTIGNNGKDNGVAIIGNNCYIGANVVILGKIEIGDNVMIGAGSIVTKSVMKDSVVAGVPAHFIRENNSN